MEDILTCGSWCGTDMTWVPAIFGQTTFGISQGKPIENHPLPVESA